MKTIATGGGETLIDVLCWRAAERPDADAYLFLADGETETARLTWADVDRRARAIGASLQQRDAVGQRALIIYPAEAGAEYLTAFLGCLYAGAIAVPCDAVQGRAGTERLGWIAQDATPRFVLGPPETNGLVAPAACPLDVAELPDAAADGWRHPGSGPATLALLQYTSGSTGNPRGVMVSHGNVMANEAAIAATCEHDGDSRFVGWLPLYHDMGLIANLLQPLYLGSQSVLMPPAAFLARPMRWLAAVSKYRGVTSGGPNFAYDLCAARARPEDLDGLDLSSWRVAFNGAEVVRAATLLRFVQAFGPAGFRPETFFPCYGLAEGTLIVSGAPRGVLPRTFSADRSALRDGRCVPPAGPEVPKRTLVSSGRPVIETAVAIVDPDTGAEVTDGTLGEVWVSGPGVAGGYWGRASESAAVFGARLPGFAGTFLRTGDVGTMLDGELYVVARLKDMIIIRGQNHYPEDLEHTAERAHRALRPSCGAAFSVDDLDDLDSERLVILYEVDTRAGEPDVPAIAAAVRQAISERHQIEVHAVALVPRGSVPKTTSGKVRRLACRDRYLAGAMPLIGVSALAERDLGARGVTLPSLPDLASSPAADRVPALASALLAAVAARVGVPVSTLDPGAPLSAAGIDSLGAIEIEHRIQDRYRVALPPLALLGDATATDLAAEILRLAVSEPAQGEWTIAPIEAGERSIHQERRESQPERREVPPERREGPLGSAQRALWFEHELAPPGPAYALVRVLRLRGELNHDALDSAVGRLVERHDALRTRFTERDGEPIQIVEPTGPAIRCEDLGTADDAAVTARLAAEAARPFVLRDAGPPVRFLLLRRSATEHLLLIAAHHIVADFWSLVVLIRELTALYHEAAGGAPADLPPLRTSLIQHALRDGGAGGSHGGAEVGQAQRDGEAGIGHGSHGRGAEVGHVSDGGGAGDERLWAYWRQRLEGAPAALELPTDRPRPAIRGFRGASHPVRLDAELTARLRRLGREHRTTLFATVLAAFQLLLGRHAGQRDVVVGTLASGRDRAELADVVGCFVNVVPVRATLDERDTFRALIGRVRDDLLRDLRHAAYPFAELVGRLRPVRDGGRPPLVQALMVLHQEHGPRADGLRAAGLGIDGPLFGSGLLMQSVAVPQPWTHLDLTLNLAEVGGVLQGGFEYDPALFDAETIAALAERFARLLSGVAGDPGRPLRLLPLPTPAEREAALAAGCGPARPRDPRASLHGLVLDRAARCPDATAVALPADDGTTEQLSYRALRLWSARLAARLADAGVGPGDMVGVLLHRSLALPAALLAVLTRGAAYLPLDPDDPPARLAWLVRDAGIHTVISTDGLADALRGCAVLDAMACLQVPPLHRSWAFNRTHSAAPGAAVPAVEVHPEHAAYVIYTSGSTGRPKGVVVPHRGIVNRLLWMQEAFELGPHDRVVHKAPTTFDVSLWELFWPLAEGACLVLAPPGAHRDPGRLAGVLHREQVSTAHFVPSLLAEFLAVAGSAPAAGRGCGISPVGPSRCHIVAEGLPALRRVVCSGEALPARLRDRVHSRLAARLYNLYGPTETSVDVTAWECRRGERGPVPIGLPIANTAVYVLDGELEPVPPLVRGELWIAGGGLARGYLGRPGLTAAAFVPDPLAAEPGARLYRTGDRARRRADGVIEYLGRADHQVKIAGVRIELGEVEDAVRAQPGVHAAAVAVHDDGSGPALVAYVVPSTATANPTGANAADAAGADAANLAGAAPADATGAVALDVTGIVAGLRQRLPAALVPTVVVLPELPSTASGKLDRAALPAPAAATRVRTAPRPGAEQRIAAVWSTVLGGAEVGADDDFFALGGDSIRALRLVAALRQAGIAVTVADLLAGTTVRALAAAGRVEPLPDAELGPFALCPDEQRNRLPAEVEDAYPVSMAQRAVLFHQMQGSGHEVYVTSVHVRSNFDEPALGAALAAALARHAYLRSSFDLTSGREPFQLVHRWLDAPLTVHDLRGTPAPAQEAVLAGWLRAERRRPLDVAAGPLLRCAVHVRSDGAFQLSLSSFALDGWCTATVFTELLVDYAAFRAGRPSPLTDPAIGYSAFVALEQLALRSAEQREFWAAELDGAEPCRLPQRAAAASDPLTRRYRVTVEPGLVAALRRIAQELSVPLKSVLLAAHLRVVRLLSGQRTVITGLEVNGRPECHDGDRVVGVFNNIVPLRLPVAAGSWVDLVRAAVAAEHRLLPYRRYPFAELEREHRVSALFDTLFVFTHFHIYDQARALDGVDLMDWQAPDQTYVPLTAHFNIDAITGELRLMLDHDPARVGDGLAAEIAGYYLRALARLAADPDAPHAAADLLPPEELRTQLAGATTGMWASHGSLRDGRTVHELILRQAARTPDAVAVRAHGDQLTYRALADRSGRLAAVLRAAGAGPDTLVGLPGRCDPGLVVGLLAILRTGAAYLPFDPAHPAPRLAATFAGIPFVLTRPDDGLPLPAGCRLVNPAAVSPAVRELDSARVDPAAGTAGVAFADGDPPVHPDSLAYAIATSGTTGAPKLVGVPHAAAVHYLSWCARAYELRPGVRTVAHSSVAFDLTVTSLLGPLVTGGAVELVTPDGIRDALAAGADGPLKITPAHLEAVGHQLGAAGVRPASRCIVAGGEQLRRRHLSSWPSPVAVFNEYGPTEATVGCVVHRDDGGEDPVPIGRPIPGMRAVVLHGGLPVPVGTVAELHLGGAGLARGYLGRPAQTALRFVPDPYDFGARLYRTGDLVRLGEDGLLRFVGRADRQLKLRGFRVDPAEIEDELCRHPAVRCAAVVAAPTDAALAGNRLLGYWVPRDGLGIGTDAESGPVLEWLAQRLPPQLVPAELIRLPGLPLTTHGKVDHRRLVDPVAARREALAQFAASLSDTAAAELLALRSGSRR